ncbi:MAG: hypothetical protein DYG89_17325 [Caldilinea sp. CFX5]|nr:hypothetical protein [Caldilinea sp. CFX5]
MMTNVMELPTLNLQEIRTDLERERNRIWKQLNGGGQVKTDDLGRNPNRDDLADSYVTFEQQSVLQTMEQKKLAQIESALQRLDNGLYGWCADCGASIQPERLEIVPSTIFCVECQQRNAT